MRSLLLALFAAAAALPAQTQGIVLANGTTGHVDVPYSPTLMPASGITVEAWITYDSSLGSGWRFPTILRGDPTPNQSSYFLRVEAGQTMANRLLWWVSTNTGNYTCNWFYTAGALSSWTHVAATYDGTALRIFANGVQVAQTPANGTMLDTNGSLRIGGGDLSITGGETWNGEIDEVRVWPFARTAAAIASTMNLQLQSIPGQVSTWNLEGNADDSSGTNHGTLAGTAAFQAHTRVEQTLPFNGLIGFGYGSGCQTGARCAAAAPPIVGNAGFGFVGTHANGSAVGIAALSFGALPAPLPVLGIDVFVDPIGAVLLTVVPDVLGTTNVPLAIPASPTVAGLALHTQFAWLDGSCATGFSASDATTAIVIP